MSILNMVYGQQPILPKALCFTANTNNCRIGLSKLGSPSQVSLEISYNGRTWSSYTIGSNITLSNSGDKVFFRNSSETTTSFSSDYSNCYYFNPVGYMSASGDVTYLLNKNGTNMLSSNCFIRLFYNNTSLITPPELPATSLAELCYSNMFFGCTSLSSIPKLPATTLKNNCYYYMFYGCTNIKLSTTKTGDYQTSYRIPTYGSGTTGTNSMLNMFYNTGGTFTGTPSINTTYYTSNTVI